LITLEETILPFNILEVNNLTNESDPAIDFVVDKDIELIVVATSSSILIFDMAFTYQDTIKIGAGI
jgi:hypothetical protein